MSHERAHESEVVEPKPATPPGAPAALAPPIGNRAFAALVARGGWQLPQAPARNQVVSVLARRPARRVLAREATRDERIEAVKKSLAGARDGTGSWTDVAVKLNGLSTGDITRQTAGMSNDELASTRAAAERDLRESGWPVQHLLDGIDATAASKGAMLRPQSSSIWGAYGNVKYNPNPPGSGSWSGLSGPEAWDTVGGSVGQGFGPKSNSCAARLSYAFNYGGFPIRDGDTGWIYYNDPKVTYDKSIPESVKKKAGDGKRYIVSAGYMEKYLTKKWGKPKATLKTNDEAKTFAGTLGADQIAIFAGFHHVGVIKQHTADGYKDPYLFTDAGVLPVSAWTLA